jgi:hypothetical protein
MIIQNKKAVSLILFLALVFSLSGCSFSGNQDSPQEQKPLRQVKSISNPTTQVAVKELEKTKDQKLENIEITWQAPTDPVEGYIIRYGSTQEQLDNQEVIYVKELESIPDEKHGRIFRHNLTNIPSDQPMFVEITAFQGELQSEPSEIFEAQD